MKVSTTTKQATKGNTVYQAMPVEMQIALKGKTINQAIEMGLITDLADDKGNFIKKSAKPGVEDAYYAIVNETVVRVSSGLAKVLEDVPSQVGDLKFTGGKSTIEGEGFGKDWFRLSLPQGYNLSDEEADTVKLKLEPVEDEVGG